MLAGRRTDRRFGPGPVRSVDSNFPRSQVRAAATGRPTAVAPIYRFSRSVMRSPVVTAPSDADETMAAYLAMTPLL